MLCVPPVTRWYEMFIHVSIMIFVGFGFLMTFLKQYGYSALGLNFLLSTLAFLWNILVRPGRMRRVCSFVGVGVCVCGAGACIHVSGSVQCVFVGV